MFTAHTQGKAAHLLRWMSAWCWENAVSSAPGPVPALLETRPVVSFKPGHTAGWGCSCEFLMEGVDPVVSQIRITVAQKQEGYFVEMTENVFLLMPYL